MLALIVLLCAAATTEAGLSAMLAGFPPKGSHLFVAATFIFDSGQQRGFDVRKGS